MAYHVTVPFSHEKKDDSIRNHPDIFYRYLLKHPFGRPLKALPQQTSSVCLRPACNSYEFFHSLSFVWDFIGLGRTLQMLYADIAAIMTADFYPFAPIIVGADFVRVQVHAEFGCCSRRNGIQFLPDSLQGFLWKWHILHRLTRISW